MLPCYSMSCYLEGQGEKTPINHITLTPIIACNFIKMFFKTLVEGFWQLSLRDVGSGFQRLKIGVSGFVLGILDVGFEIGAYGVVLAIYLFWFEIGV